MAGTKRSRADSDTEENSNAKRHNGAAPEHEAEEETPKDQPSQDQSKKVIMAEQRDAEQKVEEKSSDSKKRTRETESTNTPEAKRKASESATKPSGTQAANHRKSSYDHGHRTKLRTTVRACKSLANCGAILNKIPRSNLITLAFALNNTKEDHRRQLLRMLPRTTIS
jgi:outer membrane biosynthesis protein TonB